MPVVQACYRRTAEGRSRITHTARSWGIHLAISVVRRLRDARRLSASGTNRSSVPENRGFESAHPTRHPLDGDSEEQCAQAHENRGFDCLKGPKTVGGSGQVPRNGVNSVKFSQCRESYNRTTKVGTPYFGRNLPDYLSSKV